MKVSGKDLHKYVGSKILLPHRTEPLIHLPVEAKIIGGKKGEVTVEFEEIDSPGLSRTQILNTEGHKEKYIVI